MVAWQDGIVDSNLKFKMQKKRWESSWWMGGSGICSDRDMEMLDIGYDRGPAVVELRASFDVD